MSTAFWRQHNIVAFCDEATSGNHMKNSNLFNSWQKLLEGATVAYLVRRTFLKGLD